MRSCRLSGSVEGVVSNHDPYSDFERAQKRSGEAASRCNGMTTDNVNLSK
jgi:hypothetical protein